MSIGYGSSHERDRVHALGAAARRSGKLSAGEMDEAKKLFLTGGQTSRELVIETFGSVSEASQHSQILEFLDQVGIDANTAPFWRITFRKWREELRPRDTGFGTRLATSPNPSVQQFAREEAARTQNP